MIFLINGLLQLAYGFQVWFAPTKTMKVKKLLAKKNSNQLDPIAQLYAKKLGPLMLSFALVCIYMEFEPYSQAKGLFAFGWTLYHLSVIIEDLKIIVNVGFKDKFTIAHSIVHTALAIGMIVYSYSNGLNMFRLLINFL